MLAVAALLTSACSGGANGEGEFGQQGEVPVLVAKVERKSIAEKLHAIGRVDPFQRIDVKAQVGGELVEVHFSEGDYVRKGDLLLTIDPRPYRAALRQAQADLMRNEAQLAQAQADEKRFEFLLKEGVGSQQQFDQAHAQAESLRAALAASRAAVEVAKLNLSYTAIRSPVDGRTGDLRVNAGNLVKANDDMPLVVINQVKPIYVSFSVPEKDLPQIRTHLDSQRLPVEARAPSATQIWERGELTFIDNRVDPQTGTILLKGLFANQDERLWPGQFVDAYLTLGERPDVLVVPSEAVQVGQSGSFVFVVDDAMKVEPRNVVIGRAVDGQTVIERGLQPGETVVTDGQLRLSPGVTVSIKRELKAGNGPS